MGAVRGYKAVPPAVLIVINAALPERGRSRECEGEL